MDFAVVRLSDHFCAPRVSINDRLVEQISSIMPCQAETNLLGRMNSFLLKTELYLARLTLESGMLTL